MGYYISDRPIQAILDTGLAADEIETIVGRFAAHSSRAGKLKGKVVILPDGTVEIHRCFGTGVLWSSND